MLSLSDMQSLEHRRYYNSLVSEYANVWTLTVRNISRSFFQTCYTKYNARSRGINLEQSGYNNKFNHNPFTYIVSRLWNKLPVHIKTSSKFSDFTQLLFVTQLVLSLVASHCCNFSFFSPIYRYMSLFSFILVAPCTCTYSL